MIDPPEGVPSIPTPDDEPEPPLAADFDAPETLEVQSGGGRRPLRTAVALTLVAAIVVFGAIGGARLTRFHEDPPAPAAPARLVAIDASGGLATMDGLGGSVVPWSVPGIAFSFPVWSPDATHVAALGQGADGVGLYVFAAPASDRPAAPATDTVPRVVYQSLDEAPFYLYWTPGSRAVGFLTTESAGIALRLAPADGSATATIIRQGAPLYWDWVDAGRLVAHIGGIGPGAFIGEMGVDGTADQATVVGTGATSSPGSSAEPGSADSPGAFRSPAVSHDGRYRAFIEGADGAGERIVLQARDGSGSQAQAVSGMTAFSFDPSGNALAYVAPDPTSTTPPDLPIGPLRLLDASTGASRTLLNGKVVAFFWSPNGRTIATLGVPGPGDDGVQAVNNGIVPAVALIPSRSRSDAIEAAAGVGVHLAFVDVATGAIRFQRDVRISDTFTNQILPYFDQYALSHRFWSADSISLALPLVGADGADQLVVIPEDGSDPHPISGRVMGFWSP